MARRYNTAAIQSGAAGAGAVGEEPDWVSIWDAQTSGNFLRSFPLSVAISALALGERIELPAESLSIVKSPTNGTLVSGILITNGGSGYTSATAISFTGGGRGREAAAEAIIESGVITGAVITNPGFGYSNVPTVVIGDTGGGSAAAGTAILSGRETEASATDALEGETAADWWIQFHDGNPGAAGTANAISDLARVQQASTNWTTAT